MPAPRKLRKNRLGRRRKIEDIHMSDGRKLERQKIYEEMRNGKLSPSDARVMLTALDHAREERRNEIEADKLAAVQSYNERIAAMERVYRDHGPPQTVPALPAPGTDTRQ